MTASADYVSRNSNGDRWQLVATDVYDRIVREDPALDTRPHPGSGLSP
jgi:hypothetical protein